MSTTIKQMTYLVWSINVGWRRALIVSQKSSINAIGNRKSEDKSSKSQGGGEGQK
jgi:hypothetical protein